MKKYQKEQEKKYQEGQEKKQRLEQKNTLKRTEKLFKNKKKTP